MGEDAQVDEIELVDAGGTRRLERFGPHLVDRPAQSAGTPIRDPAGWHDADLVYTGGRWTRGAATPPWCVVVDGLTLELRPATGGQVGLFLEHAGTWAWIGEAASRTGTPVLSLFAYTGGATLACARAGASVAHVDASRTAVAWARQNAAHSGLGGASIRWLVDDAATFVSRELRRGRRYGGLILDPPSYGHGSGGRDWRIERDLEPLLANLAVLAGDDLAFVQLTTHTPGFGPDRLGQIVREAFGVAPETGELALHARSGAELQLGAHARWRR